jgi:hypothetical protein
VQITLDRYGHLLPASYDSAGERLELALFGLGLQACASSGSETDIRSLPPIGDGEAVSAAAPAQRRSWTPGTFRPSDGVAILPERDGRQSVSFTATGS